MWSKIWENPKTSPAFLKEDFFITKPMLSQVRLNLGLKNKQVTKCFYRSLLLGCRVQRLEVNLKNSSSLERGLLLEARQPEAIQFLRWVKEVHIERYVSIFSRKQRGKFFRRWFPLCRKLYASYRIEKVWGSIKHGANSPRQDEKRTISLRHQAQDKPTDSMLLQILHQS
jgi:hypothetical protein